MKKQLLISTSILFSGMLCAQVAGKQVNKIPANIANRTVLKTAINADVNTPSFSSSIATQKPKFKTPSNQKVTAPVYNVIGHTYYDLQTNSSVGDRIVVNNDGSIAATWTMEFTDPGTTYPNRGTGYNYFNGTAWAPEPTVRIDNARTGWGNIAHTRSGKEIVLSHNGGASKLHLTTRPVKGTGVWANSTTAIPTATTGGNFWPRMVTSSPAGGDTIYVLSLTYPVGSGGALWQGLDGAVVFSRSTDGGTTWDIVNQVPAGLTSASFRGFSGDGYAIAANGPVVAIVAGDSDKDVVMTKSLDGGVTWSSRTVYKCPITKWDHITTTSEVYPDGNADTLETNDGTFSIALDNANKAYVFFGRMRILQDAVATSQTYSYFPGTDGLYMWHEGMANGVAGTSDNDNGMAAVMVAAIEDLYQQGTIYFPTPAVAADSPWGSFGCSLTSYPSAAFDNNNVLYLSYSSIVDSLRAITNPEKLVRHVYVMKSMDGGISFGPMVELDKVIDPLNDLPYEGVYASMAKKVDGSVHIVYQRDLYPGFGVSQTNSDIDNQGDLKEIVYSKIPTSEILTDIKNMATTNVASLNFYPNPTSTNGTIDVQLNETDKLDITVLNSVGQSIYSTTINGNIGSNKVNINLNNLSSGLYFYQVKVGNSKAITKKFVVQK